MTVSSSLLFKKGFTPLESPVPRGGWDEYNPLPFSGRAVGSKASPFLTGFTIVEFLVVVAIIFILAALSFEAFRYFGKESDLNTSSEEVIGILRTAQNKTLASEGASQYGVYFDAISSPHQYTLFKGGSYAGRDISFDEVHKLQKGVEISEINLSGGAKEVVFNRVTGGTNQSGDIKIRLIEDPARAIIISIDPSGRVIFGQEASPVALPNPRDSRHTHFYYDNNAQNAFALRLVFPDYPGDNFNIDFQTFLDAGKTEFFWEGTILVGPSEAKTEQRLIIHTHSLTAFAAQFCIHRPLSSDQSYNNKALNIFLDNEELIRYAGDLRGTTTKGLSVFASDPLWQ